MKIYVLDRVDQVSANWHSEGGLVIVARDDKHLRELVASDPNVEVTDDELAHARVLRLHPDENPNPGIHVHPDAGCC